jgi:hypothetical protein
MVHVPTGYHSILSVVMRITVPGLAVALALIVPVFGACGSSGGNSSTTADVAAASTTAAPTAASATAATDGSTTAPDDSVTTTTTPADAQATGDAIALSDALGYDLSNDDAACIKQSVGDATVALLDENDIGALTPKVQGDLFQALAKCAHDTIVTNFVTVLPGLLGVTEDEASCVGEAYIAIYKDNRRAAEQGAKTFNDADADVRSYIRTKLSACMPADKVDEFLSQQAG